MLRDKLLLSTIFGDVNGDLNSERLSLYGKQEEKDSFLLSSLSLRIEDKNISKFYSIDMIGYEFRMYAINILDNNKDQILITGKYGGTGGYAIFRLYEYKNNKLKLILDDKSLTKQLYCSAKYLKGYKVEINCKEKFIIDISESYEGYLKIAYDLDGNVNEKEEPTVSNANTIYPILTEYNDFYNLQIQQRIVGVSNGDLIGAIQSLIEVNENGKIKIVNQYLLLFNRNINRSNFLQLPLGANLISLNKFGGEGDLLEIDINTKEEILFAYNYNGLAYLGIGFFEDNKFKVLDTIEGNGSDISYLNIKPIDNTNKKRIIIGWKIREISSNLDILSYENNELKSILNNKDLYFGKLDVIDFNNDGIYDIVLWSHDTGEAYIVNIYEYDNYNLIKTNKYDKLYYKKVLNYYENLLKEYPKSTTYLYYLSIAQCKLGIDNSETIKKMLSLPNPYPIINNKTCEN